MNLALTMAVLRPGENVSPDMSSYESMVAHWRGTGNPPTLQQCEAAWVTINANLYSEKRVAEYPKISELADALSKIHGGGNQSIIDAGQAQLEEYSAACMAVKVKYPKPA